MADIPVLHLPVWTFVAVASMSATLGAMVASQFEAVKVHANIYVATAATPAILALILIQSPVSLAFALWTMLLIAVLSGLAVMDAVTRTVPDILTLPLIGLGLLHAQTNGAPGLHYMACAAGIVLVAWLARTLLPRAGNWLGGGDVLLLAAAVAWFGPAMLPDILFLTGVLLFARLCLGQVIELGPPSCVPVSRAPDHALPLAPALGAAQLLIWMGGPFF